MNQRIQAIAAEAKQYARDQMNHNMMPELFSAAVFEQRYAELLIKAVAAEAHSRVCLEGNDNLIYDHLLLHFGLDPSYPTPQVFTFEMNDVWGDDYSIDVTADSEPNARAIAARLDDDAVPGRVISQRKAE